MKRQRQATENETQKQKSEKGNLTAPEIHGRVYVKSNECRRSREGGRRKISADSRRTREEKKGVVRRNMVEMKKQEYDRKIKVDEGEMIWGGVAWRNEGIKRNKV
ncbi:hypothetical protein C8R44DRAFT_817934 [Mycena epipterygia]|nr:hypothetical protein C8R44DRAFT_817934 [Mycena epipterygia]